MTETATTTQPTRTLASFLANLRYEDLPDEVVERTKELFLDWSASAGKGDRRLHRGGIREPGATRVLQAGRDGADPAVDAAYPECWIGLVDIETTDGETIISRVDVPKGDPGNTLSREALEYKARNLAAFRGGASDKEITRIIDRAWGLENEGDVRDLLDAERRDG